MIELLKLVDSPTASMYRRSWAGRTHPFSFLWCKIVVKNCGAKLWGQIVAQTELSTTVTITNDHHHQQQHHDNFHDKEGKLAS